MGIRLKTKFYYYFYLLSVYWIWGYIRGSLANINRIKSLLIKFNTIYRILDNYASNLL